MLPWIIIFSNFSTGSIVVVALGAVVIAGAIVFVIKNKKK